MLTPKNVDINRDMARIALRCFAESKKWEGAVVYADMLFGGEDGASSIDIDSSNDSSAMMAAIRLL